MEAARWIRPEAMSRSVRRDMATPETLEGQVGTCPAVRWDHPRISIIDETFQDRLPTVQLVLSSPPARPGHIGLHITSS
jgi:hypothetical protein